MITFFEALQRNRNQRRILFFLALSVLLFFIYQSTLNKDFLPWDDDYNITLNSNLVRGHWLEFWRHVHYGLFIPVTSSWWTFLYQIGGGEPWLFRVSNLLLHLCNVFLLGLLIEETLPSLSFSKRAIGLWGLALFALHPLQVESVAWISAGRDLLSSALGLLSLWIYLRKPGGRNLALATLFFVLGLLAKPQIASLPAVAFLLSLFLRPERWKRSALELSIWLLPVLWVVFSTFDEQKQYIVQSPEGADRLLVMSDSFGFYLWKIFWPVGLAVDYGRSPSSVLNGSFTHLGFLALAALLVMAGLWQWKKEARPFCLLFTCWWTALLPVSGIVDFAYQDISTTADHYAYLSIALLALSSLPVFSWLQDKMNTKFSKSLFHFFAAMALVTLIFLSWARTQVWQSPETFFADMVRGNPQSYSAFIGLGGVHTNHDEDKALHFFRRALEIKPGDGVATANIVATLFRMKRYPEVLQWEPYLLQPAFTKALELHHILSGRILSALAASLYVNGSPELAFRYFCQAIWSQPESPEIQKALDSMRQVQVRNQGLSECPADPRPEVFQAFVHQSLLRRGKISQ